MALTDDIGGKTDGRAPVAQGRPAAPGRNGAGTLGRAMGAGLDRVGLRDARLATPVVLYLLAVVLPVHFGLGPLNMTGVRLLLIVLVIPLSINLFAGKYGRVLLTDILFFAHIFWALVALVVNNPGQVVTNIGSTGVEFLGGYLVGRAYIRNAADFVALIRWLVVIAFCLLPFVLVESQTGRPLILEAIRSLPGIDSVRPVNIGGRLGMERVQSVFAHPIHSGLFFSFIFALTFTGMRGVFSNSTRYAATVVSGICTFLALSSGALLALALQLGLLIWAWVFRNSPRKWLLLYGLFALLYVIIDLSSTRTPIRVFMSYATFSAHTAYWRSIIFEWGMVNVWANPIFGLGLNDWVRPSYMVSGSMDNFWLVMAVRYGIPGFLTVAGGWFIGILTIGRRDFGNDTLLLNLRRAWVFCIVGLSFTLITVHIWHTIYSCVFFVFGAGMWLLDAQGQQAPAPAAAGRRREAGTRRDTGPREQAAATADRPEFSALSSREQAGGGSAYTRFAPRPGRGRKD